MICGWAKLLRHDHYGLTLPGCQGETRQRHRYAGPPTLHILSPLPTVRRRSYQCRVLFMPGEISTSRCGGKPECMGRPRLSTWVLPYKDPRSLDAVSEFGVGLISWRSLGRKGTLLVAVIGAVVVLVVYHAIHRIASTRDYSLSERSPILKVLPAKYPTTIESMNERTIMGGAGIIRSSSD
jgi:hypothetical protein